MVELGSTLMASLIAAKPLLSPRHRLQLGPCEIGNWSPTDVQLSSPIRNFNGRIDELAILQDALDAHAIEAFFEQGHP